MSQRPRILWIGEGNGPPANVQQAVAGHWDFACASKAAPLAEQLQDVSVAMIRLNGSAGNPQKLQDLLEELSGSEAVVLVLLPEHARLAHRMISQRHGQFLCVSESAPPTDLAARLSAAKELQPALHSLRQELATVRDQRQSTEHALEEIDEQLRLAARLQRDFLPRRLPEVGSARFGVLYRPLSWVSGDIYDVARLDETHVCMYIADAVGHGMPAALLTMFIKKALQTKRISGQSYEIVPPDDSLGQLNADICDQNLSASQFCTAVYGVLDVSTLELTYARAGHPEPILVRGDGRIEFLNVRGALLGVFDDQTFPSQRVQLQQGDRIVFYTDGLEEALRPPDVPRETPLSEIIRPWLSIPRDELLLAINARVERHNEQGCVDDDVTVVVMDV